MFKHKELRAWQSLLETRRDWLAQRGIRYVFVIAPNKESIYPEMLPSWLAEARPKSKLDQFLAYMKTNSTVEILDLRPVLLEAKKIYSLYWLTDTHWNYDGAFFAHQELVRTLSRQLPGLEPLPAASFTRIITQQPGGDLAAKLGREQTMPEKEYALWQPIPPLRRLEMITAPQLVASNKWNQSTYPAFTENTNKKGTAIVFRDSFGGYWIPFLGYYFGKVIYVWEDAWEPEFIEKERPVVLIDEMLERMFYSENPAKLKMGDKLK